MSSTRPTTAATGSISPTGEKYDVMIVDRMLPRWTACRWSRRAHVEVRDAGAVPHHHGRHRRSRRGPRGRRRRLSGQALRLRRADGAGRGAGAPAADRARRPCCASAISRWTCWRAPSRAAASASSSSPEFKLLEFLMRHAGESVTRTMLLEKVWDFHFDPKTNSSRRISPPARQDRQGLRPPLLHTVRGAGYVIRQIAD